MAPASPKRSTAISAFLAFIGMSAVAGVLATVAVTPAIALTGIAAGGGIGMFEDLPENLEIKPLDEKTNIWGKDGDQDVLLTSFYAQNRETVDWDGAGEWARAAAIAGEDERFYDHGGVDLQSIARAALTNLTGRGFQGGSTLTMQYVKNVCLSDAERLTDSAERQQASLTCAGSTLDRKIREARYAIGVEKQYTKDEILLGYLNIALFGGRVYGIQSAARYYYNVDARDLTPAQAASILAITNDPENLRLDIPENLPANTERRDFFLSKMLELGSLTQAQYDEAVATVTTPVITPTATGCGAAGAAGFFCSYVEQTILKTQNATFGETPEDRWANLNRAGWNIYTTLDVDQNNAAKAAVNAQVPAATDVADIGAVATSVEAGTGRILTMALNKEFDETADDATYNNPRSALNLATDQDRGGSVGFQPGSTYKTFTLLQWLKDGNGLYDVVNGSERVEPRSSFTACGQPLSGQSWDIGNDANERGNFTIMAGTAQSVNGVFASMGEETDLCDTKALEEAFGLHPSNTDAQTELSTAVNPPQIIGGADLMSPLTMAAAYAGVAANGLYCAPRAIDRIVAADGTELPIGNPECTQAVDPEIAVAAQFALQGVISDGTARRANTNDGTALIGKTGTTDDAKHTWLLGASSSVATAVWVGNINGAQSMRETRYTNEGGTRVTASDVRHVIWRTTMQSLNGEYGGKESWDRPAQQFLTGRQVNVPNVVGQTVDSATGILGAAGFALVDGGQRDSDRPVGTIVEQNPSGTASRGADVTVYTSNGAGGANASGTVPSVAGQQPAAAIGALRQAGFTNLSAQFTQGGGQCQVTGTSPAGGSTAPVGQPVIVSVTGPNQASCLGG